MARIAAPDPYASLKQQTPRMGPPVQNMGGFAMNTAPMMQRPFPPPSVRMGPPGPTPLSPSPNPSGVSSGFGRTASMLPSTGLTPGTTPGLPQTASTPTTAVQPASATPAPPPPAAAPGTSSSSLSTGYYGSSGGVSPGTQSTLEDQIRNYITQSMQGSVTPDFINRAKGDVFRTVTGQTKSATNQINEDAIRRGLFRSGIPAESIANVQGQAQGALARGVADVLNNAENVNIAGRQAAAGTAGNLLSSNREWDQYTQQRADAAAARAAANSPRTFTYVDPDTGQSYQLDESWF